MEIIDHTLKYLSIFALSKLRIVCKDWNALHTLDHFCNSYIGNQSKGSYLLRFQYREFRCCALYNLDKEKYVKMDFTFVLNAIKKILNRTKDDSKITILETISIGGL